MQSQGGLCLVERRSNLAQRASPPQSHMVETTDRSTTRGGGAIRTFGAKSIIRVPLIVTRRGILRKRAPSVSAHTEWALFGVSHTQRGPILLTPLGPSLPLDHTSLLTSAVRCVHFERPLRPNCPLRSCIACKTEPKKRAKSREPQQHTT